MIREKRENTTMGKKKPVPATKKNDSNDRGYTPMIDADDYEDVKSRRDIDGYVRWNQEDENQVIVEGKLTDIFSWKDSSGDDRETIIVQIGRETHGLTLTDENDEESDAVSGQYAGMDMKQGLKGLADKIGRTVKIVCHGKIGIGGNRTTYQFEVGVRKDGKARKSDDVPFA
jgi:hypothetical protein